LQQRCAMLQRVLRSPSAMRFSSVVTRASSTAPYLCYDVPVSNHGARVRFVAYKKSLPVTFVQPSEIGGLKSEAYLKLNPQGKMPLLVPSSGTALYESEVIIQYLLDKYREQGPSLIAPTPELRASGALVTRIHDIYIAAIQGCMYRKMESAEQRVKDLAQLAVQLDAIEALVVGPFICGDTITAPDGALFPTVVFMEHILPKYFGWPGIFQGRPLLAKWWDSVKEDPAAKKVISEVQGGLDAWEKSDRWNALGIVQQVAENKHLKFSP